MPVRSLSSSVLKWPDRKTVDQAVRSWARSETTRHRGVVKIGYFGSYARGDWGVGSDLDLVAIVKDAIEPFVRRGASWDLADLPVAAEILVYTEDEWRKLQEEDSRFARTLREETVWVV